MVIDFLERLGKFVSDKEVFAQLGSLLRVYIYVCRTF